MLETGRLKLLPRRIYNNLNGHSRISLMIYDSYSFKFNYF